ncbi:hypothetical protein [Nitrospirillum sp. BR 11163]|uniref:anti-sigma factor family protein n=1 Tax=Nitrospirillum sp. BR 11163 TaxID=3104323 RepID=UPI002AFDE0D3|nr:hypothetical protein [Nitrospirillum sp. BR 11163]MEA1671852.1 hypothetical protein [Nitrospirillum sp. BR 11163]
MSDHTPNHPSIAEVDLHAFLDGELPEDRARVVEAAILADPALAERLAGYEADKAMMKRLYSPLIDRPVPQHLIDLAQSVAGQPAARPWADWRRLGAVAAVVLLLAGGGAYLAGRPAGDVVQMALAARDVPAVVPSDLAPYNAALSRVVALNIKVPDLTRAGYRLAGVKVEGQAATVAYRDADDRLFTIYLRHSDGTVRFDQFKRDNLRVCVWQDDQLSMVMAGEMSAAVMQKLASMAYVGLTA